MVLIRRDPTCLLAGNRPRGTSWHLHSKTVSYVYAFSHKHRRPPMEYKDLLGGKGANLAEMTSVLKLPVPPGFTISTDACRAYMKGGWPEGLDEEIAAQVFKLEQTMGRKLGDPFDPLLVSVRSGAKFSMPGMMDTVLNLGLNDASVKGLAHVTNDERFAYDSYRRFIAMYGRIVLDVDGELFEHPLEAAKAAAGVKTDAELTAKALKSLCKDYQAVVKKATRKPFPQDPIVQLRGAIEAVEDVHQLGVDLREVQLHVVEVFGVANARHHVFALGVDEEVAVRLVLARGRVAGEPDAGAAVVVAVAEHHRLHVDGEVPIIAARAGTPAPTADARPRPCSARSPGRRCAPRGTAPRRQVCDCSCSR